MRAALLKAAAPAMVCLLGSPMVFGSIPVKITFVEALAPKDTTSSERFQKEYENSVETSKRFLANRLKKCGYSLATETAFYGASDPLQAKEQAQLASAKGAWLIVGPRRSNHYILLAQGAEQTPTVSLMASAAEIAALGPRHSSLSPLNANMASAAVAETQAALHKDKPLRFFSIVSSDCMACTDFADSFEKTAKKKGMTLLERINVSGETPSLQAKAEEIHKLVPDFVLLPDYSKTASHLMGQVAALAPRTLFVGSDGWGDSSFGFVHASNVAGQVDGFTVRGFPPFEIGLKDFRLGREVAKNKESLANFSAGAPSLGVLRVMDGLAETLCASRPKTKEDFAKTFEKNASRLFTAPWGVSVYTLKEGQIKFKKAARKSP